MKTNHTSGEWVIEKGFHRHNVCAGHKGFIIAEVTGDCISHFIGNTEEAEANAKLIAAAPELLSALELADSVLKILADLHGADYNVSLTARTIQAVIKKATE